MKIHEPNLWEEISLGDYVSFHTGKLNSNAAKVDGAYPFFTCSQETFRTDTFSFDCECVLLAGNNANGIYPLKFFSGQFDAYQRTYVIRSTDTRNLNNRFLYYALRLQLELMRRISTGAATKFLTLTLLKEIKLRKPPIKIQERIASLLSAYDDLIENNTRRIEILEGMARTLYREWFVHFRYPRHTLSKMIDSSLGRIPDTWKIEPLGALCSRITDGSHWSPITVESGRPMASSKDMHRWGLNTSTCRTISDDDFDELIRNDCKPLAGDVLITKDGANYLKFCFAVERDIDVVILSSIALLRPNPGKLSPLYLSLCLTDPAIRTRLAGRVSGVAIPRIVLKDFRTFRIGVPPTSLQAEFDRVVGPIAQLCRKLIDENTNLRSTRDVLLPRLIAGEINVENPETESSNKIS